MSRDLVPVDTAVVGWPDEVKTALGTAAASGRLLSRGQRRWLADGRVAVDVRIIPVAAPRTGAPRRRTARYACAVVAGLAVLAGAGWLLARTAVSVLPPLASAAVFAAAVVWLWRRRPGGGCGGVHCGGCGRH